jgi:hypothetical protein
MTAPDGFTIFKDEPLLSKENGKDVQMHFQRLHDAILHTRGDGGDKAECNTSTTENSAIGAMNRVGRDSSTADVGAERARTDEQSAKDFPRETKAKIRSGLWTVRGSEVIPKRVDAIWKDSKGGVRLARGEHTLIAGEPVSEKVRLSSQRAPPSRRLVIGPVAKVARRWEVSSFWLPRIASSTRSCRV